MRWTTLSLVLILVAIAIAGQGQITLKEKNASFEKVLADIEKQSKYVFLYDPDEVKRIGPITIEVKNTTLQEALRKCFKGLPIEFIIVGKNVLLKRKAGT